MQTAIIFVNMIMDQFLMWGQAYAHLVFKQLKLNSNARADDLAKIRGIL